MEYEKAYTFQPEVQKPAKRRRVNPRGLQSSWQQRRHAFHQAWGSQQRAIDVRLNSINASTVDNVWEFLDQAINKGQNPRIPTGIILTGADGAAEAAIFKAIAKRAQIGEHRRILVCLSSASGTNLKGLLKTLIQRATSPRGESNDDFEDEDEPEFSRVKGAKLLNYDVQILHDFVREHRIAQVIVAFEDTEAFDSDLLSDFIESLGYWQDRIPFTYLLNVATSLDFLQQRLSKVAIQALEGKAFDVTPSGDEVEHVCDAVIDSGAPLWIGSGLLGMALERQHDYIQSIDAFVEAVKYATMSHFYANALSIFLSSVENCQDITGDHFEALRQLDSFKAYAQRQLDGHNINDLKECLQSDEALQLLVLNQVADGQRKLSAMSYAMKVLRLMQRKLSNVPASSISSLYVQAMSGKLAGSPLIRSLLLNVRRAPSDVAIELLRDIVELLQQQRTPVFSDCQQLLSRFEDLIESQQHSTKPLRSEEDTRNSTLRTTVVAQRVELSKQNSALSEQDKKYTELLGVFSRRAEEMFAGTLINPKDLVFNEIFIYDLKSPYREVFTPRPRHAIERALATPSDYLDCDCCGSEEGRERGEATLAATQPATAVLYQLYLESGSLINASDLWQAFRAVLGDGKEEAETMALFQRALAELRYLGMMKSTRKRLDHVAKVMWRGL